MSFEGLQCTHRSLIIITKIHERILFYLLHQLTVDFTIFKKSELAMNHFVDDLNEKMLRKWASHHDSFAFVMKTYFHSILIIHMYLKI